MNVALVIIDIQNDYFPGGKMELVHAGEAGQKASELLCYFRNKAWPVIHVQHIANRPGATFFLPDTEGSLLHSCVKPLAKERVIVKHYPNSFRETELAQILKENNIQRLIFCGMMTHMCIDTTVRAAYDKGYQCLVAYDACATRDLLFNGQKIAADNVQGSYMAALNGLFAKVCNTGEIIRLLND